MITFAEAANISIKDYSNLSEIDEYVVRAMLKENKRHADDASSFSHRGNVRLGNFIQHDLGADVRNAHLFEARDVRAVIRSMSEYLKKFIDSYGMSRDCSFSPHYS